MQAREMGTPLRGASCPPNSDLTHMQGRRMQQPREAGNRGPRERSRKSAPGARPSGERAKGAPPTEPPGPGWELTLDNLAAMAPAQRRRHLLFGDLLQDVGLAASIFPRDSVEAALHVPDPRAWVQPLEPPGQRQDRLVGVLQAAEARGRVRALRLRYNRLRTEEISLLLRRQRCARAAVRLEAFLPPQLKPTRIPDPLNRQERRRVESILEDKADGVVFPRAGSRPRPSFPRRGRRGQLQEPPDPSPCQGLPLALPGAEHGSGSRGQLGAGTQQGILPGGGQGPSPARVGTWALCALHRTLHPFPAACCPRPSFEPGQCAELPEEGRGRRGGGGAAAQPLAVGGSRRSWLLGQAPCSLDQNSFRLRSAWDTFVYLIKSLVIPSLLGASIASCLK
nr:protein LKAAEAR1 isoform X1 [Oryctolagus cuniculus]